jgi:hypothetical protein
MTDIVVVNRSTVVPDAEVSKVVPAFQAQVTQDWLPHWPGRGATLHFCGLGAQPVAGMWPLYILDTSDVAGAGGYHEDDTGLPTGKVFAKTAMDYGISWTVDATHELLEILGDPGANTILPIPRTRLHCFQEVGDAVEADQFGYTKGGVLVTDFVLPSYFKAASRVPQKYDFAGHLRHPAPALLPGGYLAIQLPNGQWTQITARQADGSMSYRAKRNGRTAKRIGGMPALT